jgi:hypothetical protein
MANSFVGSKTFTALGSASGTFSVSLTDLKDTANSNATLLEDDLVIINYVTSSVGSDVALAAPFGWTEDAELYSNDAVDINLAAWSKVMGATPDTSVDLPNSTSANDGVVGTVFAFRGVKAGGVSATTATGIDGGQPNPAAVTPTNTGSWVVVLAGANGFVGNPLTNPGDLSATTNHFRAVEIDETIDCVAGCGIKTDWSSGAFDPSQWTGGTTNADASWAAVTYVLAPQPQTLEPSLFTNTQAFYSPSVIGNQALTPALFTNTQTFYAPTVAGEAVTIFPALLENTQTFFDAVLAGADVALLPPLFVSDNSIWHPSLHNDRSFIRRRRARKRDYSLSDGVVRADRFI